MNLLSKYFSMKQSIAESIEHPMIEHNGVMVHKNNSEGKPIHGTDEGIKNFHNWSGGHELKDAHGRPKVVYHGTKSQFDEFSHVHTVGQMGFHVGNKSQAKTVSTKNVLPLYLKMKSPLKLSDNGGWQGQYALDSVSKATNKKILGSGKDTQLRNHIIASGYDGVVYKNDFEGKGDSYIAFHPSQIKSASHNSGAFDSSNNKYKE